MAEQSDEQQKYVFYGGSTSESADAGCRSLGELIIKRLRENSDGIGFIDGVTGQSTTFSDFLEQSVRLANRFHRIGFKKNAVIAIMCENRIEVPLITFASIYMNAIPVLLNPSYNARELEHVLNVVQPRALFATSSGIKTVLQVLDKVPRIKMITLVGSKERPNSKVALFQELFDRNKLKNAKAFTPQPVNLQDQVALMVLSSGTTGLPKAVQLTHYNVMVVMANMRENHKDSPLPVEASSLGLLPFFHVYGFMVVLGCLTNGRTLVSLPKFEPELFLSTIEKYKVASVSLVPPLMVFLAKHPLVEKYDLSSLLLIGCGAAPLSKEIEEQVHKRLPNLLAMVTAYGMSESSLGVLYRFSGKAGSVGKVRKNNWVKIVDVNSGKVLGPNQIGEICVKGPMVMKGYLNNEKETRSIIDRDGWLHTGDTGYFDEEGDFYIVDRIKDLIKYKAFQVAPADVEAVLLSNPSISDAAVIGLPDESAGELPLAFVVLQPGKRLTESEVQQWVSDRMSNHNRLRGGVRFVASIPKTASGKILRRDLRAALKKAKL